jgi:hypothetical protein
MTTQQVADRLYALCHDNQFDKAQAELFAPDATSTENFMSGMPETVKGIEALKEKARKFEERVEQVHESSVGKPLVFGNNIFMEMSMDATWKNMPRTTVTEMAHYEVKDGKIISERFYY